MLHIIKANNQIPQLINLQDKYKCVASGFLGIDRRNALYTIWIKQGQNPSQIAKFMGPTWGPPGSCRPQIALILAPWTLSSGFTAPHGCYLIDEKIPGICMVIVNVMGKRDIARFSWRTYMCVAGQYFTSIWSVYIIDKSIVTMEQRQIYQT